MRFVIEVTLLNHITIEATGPSLHFTLLTRKSLINEYVTILNDRSLKLGTLLKDVSLI